MTTGFPHIDRFKLSKTGCFRHYDIIMYVAGSSPLPCDWLGSRCTAAAPADVAANQVLPPPGANRSLRKPRTHSSFVPCRLSRPT